MRDESAIAKPLLGGMDFEDFRKQQTAFCILTLFVLALLLLLHTLFAPMLGEPTLAVLGVLGASFALRLGELAWLQSQDHTLSYRAAMADGIASIISLFVLAGALAWLTDRDLSPYQVLLAIPVLQSACLFGLFPTLITIVTADGMIMLWLRHYFALYPPSRAGDYLEAGMLSTVFALAGLLVWLLVYQLRAKQRSLASALSDLHETREQLVSEEKLAAVGRLASGIAHEIRNPVAMIVGALTTATDGTAEWREREEMYAIARRQASRLENLTGEFLTYARPTVPKRSPILVGDLLTGIADAARVRAGGREIDISCHSDGERLIAIDVSQVEGALLNLALNAIDATPEAGSVEVRAEADGERVRIDIENSGAAIPEGDVERIFEPFFTTKAGGTGLGLPIAKGVANAHGGDLWVSRNEEGRVTFTMTLAAGVVSPVEKEAVHGQGFDRR